MTRHPYRYQAVSGPNAPTDCDRFQALNLRDARTIARLGQRIWRAPVVSVVDNRVVVGAWECVETR